MSIRTLAIAAMLLATLPGVETRSQGAAPPGPPRPRRRPVRTALLKRYCVTCHNARDA